MNKYANVNGNPVNNAVGELMAVNGYGYANANPVNVVDPTGLYGEDPFEFSGCGNRQEGYSCDCCNNIWESVIELACKAGFHRGCKCDSPTPTPTLIPTNTPRPTLPPTNTPRPIGTPTATPSPTITPTPTVTPQAQGFRLPMDDAALTGKGCLARRVESIYVPCSRDVNPRGQEVKPGYPVHAPNPSGVIWYAGQGGSGLGNVVILRYSVAELPSHIQNQLPPSPAGGGSLVIQYAHLTSDIVSSGNAIPEALQVGFSGLTGSEENPPHLDVSVIWIPDEAAIRALGIGNFGATNDPAQWNILTTNQAAYNARWTIDPLKLWPEMGWSQRGEDVPTQLCEPSTPCKIY